MTRLLHVTGPTFCIGIVYDGFKFVRSAPMAYRLFPGLPNRTVLDVVRHCNRRGWRCEWTGQ